MIRREDREIARAQQRLERGNVPVEALERRGITANVAPVAELRVEVVEVHEHEARLDRAHELERTEHRILIIGDANGRRNASAIKDIADLSDGMYPDVMTRQTIEQIVGRVECVVAPVRSARERSRNADEGACDHAIDLEGRHEHRASPLAPIVQRLEGHDLFVGRDLEDAVGGRVEDRPPGAHMLRAEFLDDLRAGGRHISERLPATDRRERLRDLGGKAVGKGRKRNRGVNARHLPVTRDRVLPLRRFTEPCDESRRFGNRFDTPNRGQVTEAEPLEIRKREPTHASRHVTDRIRSRRVTVRRRIGERTNSTGIENDDDASCHTGPRFVV